MPLTLQVGPYTPPAWAEHLKVPENRYGLATLPTPVHTFLPAGVPEGVDVWIKRDDLTGMQLSGNKVRKLEFLMAEAACGNHDCVLTLGGIQSNHCRATAVAARYLGLDTHLILRTSRAAADGDPGLTGNLLVERMVGAHVHLVTKEEYTKIGSCALSAQLEEQLRAGGARPYAIPVGGSSPLGTWGYIEAFRELMSQAGERPWTDIILACGSGGTAAGVALGNHLSGYGARVHAYGVCDDPNYFYNYIDSLLAGLAATPEAIGASARDMLVVRQARGEGYAINTAAELEEVLRISTSTGVVLDPVYGLKAWRAAAADMRAAHGEWRGRRVLFLHTGGLLGMFDKAAQLQPLVQGLHRCTRFAIK